MWEFFFTPTHEFLVNAGIDTSNIEMVHPRNIHSIIRMLKAGRLSLVASGENTFYQVVKEAGFKADDFEMVIPIFKLSPYMAFSLDTSPEVIDKISATYDRLIAEGKIKLQEF